jgi:hypothetical protein
MLTGLNAEHDVLISQDGGDRVHWNKEKVE